RVRLLRKQARGPALGLNGRRRCARNGGYGELRRSEHYGHPGEQGRDAFGEPRRLAEGSGRCPDLPLSCRTRVRPGQRRRYPGLTGSPAAAGSGRPTAGPRANVAVWPWLTRTSRAALPPTLSLLTIGDGQWFTQ